MNHPPKTSYREINFDGLIGPSHNYAGLSFGNLAATLHAGETAFPRQAALQGLGKMRLMLSLGLGQGFFLPHERPNVAWLRTLGFSVMTACFLGESQSEVRERVARFLAIRGDGTDPEALIAERRNRWLVGTVEEVAARLEELRELGVTRVLLQHLNHDDDAMIGLMETLR